MSIHPQAIIHETAVIMDGAEIGEGTVVGPYSTVGKNVILGKNNNLISHVAINGKTVIGDENKFYPFSSTGTEPQDLKYKGEDTELFIGNNNKIREYVTINKGTVLGGGKTVLGNENLIMACAHIAHDCILENKIVIANNCLLAGHVYIESGATLAGAVAIHHFTTIGRSSFIGGMTRITKDVPPFMVVEGNPSRIRGINHVGLSRKNWDKDDSAIIKKAYKILFHKKETPAINAISELQADAEKLEELKYLLEFVIKSSEGKFGRARENLRQDV